MSFVMIATGATSCARIRTLAVRHVLVGGVVAALLLLAAGTGLGYWLAAAPPAAVAPALAQQRAHDPMPWALEQLGTLSGRLFRLESQAAQLGKRIGVLQKDEKPADAAKKGGSGGPMLPPRSAASLEDLAELDAQLLRIEQQIAALSDATAERNLDVMRLPSRLPVLGAEVVSSFGNREDPITSRRAFHAGMDFAAERGTPILAAAGGTVSFAGYHHDFGWLVEIAHGNGLSTRYAHASKLLVKSGAVVAPGERIALVGSSGRSTGPHLHFEVLRGGKQADPRRYLAGL